MTMEGALLTGAGGFVGRALSTLLPGHGSLRMGADDWESRLAEAPLEGATVFHLAARVHELPAGSEADYRRDNVEKTVRLAEEAARRGARRLVFLSTVKVHGEESPGRPLGPDDPASPGDAYGRSKLAAEQALARIAAERGLPIVIVRSPLVFGPGAGANLRALVKLADTAWPLPLAAIDNRRSFVHVADLARLLVSCGSHPAAPGRTYVAAHEEPFSTPRLVAALRAALGRPARLFAVSPALLEAMAAAAGRRTQIQRLTRSLECDPSRAQADLAWRARVGLGQAAREMAAAWREARR